jgi:hypothetical protein
MVKLDSLSSRVCTQKIVCEVSLRTATPRSCHSYLLVRLRCWPDFKTGERSLEPSAALCTRSIRIPYNMTLSVRVHKSNPLVLTTDLLALPRPLTLASFTVTNLNTVDIGCYYSKPLIDLSLV